MTERPAGLFPDGIKGIIFDCDGVMINSASANRFLYNSILAALGLPHLTPEQEVFAFQATFQAAIRELVPVELHGRIGAACDRLNYDRDILPRIEIMPGYLEFLEKARQRGLRLAVDTNRTRSGIHKVLDFLGLPPYFNPVMSCEDVEPKPSPQGAEKICQLWRLQPGMVLFVGDSPDDMRAANAAGMVFAGFGGLRGNISARDWDSLAKLLWAAPSRD